MTTLARGQAAPLGAVPGPLTLGASWEVADTGGTLTEVVAAVVLCGEDGSALSAGHAVHLNQPTSPDEAVASVDDVARPGEDTERFTVDLPRLDPAVVSLALVLYVNPDLRAPGSLDDLRWCAVRVLDADGTEVARYAPEPRELAGAGAVVAAELVRTGDAWEVRAVGDRVAGGVLGVAASYGFALGDDAEDEPRQAGAQGSARAAGSTRVPGRLSLSLGGTAPAPDTADAHIPRAVTGVRLDAGRPMLRLSRLQSVTGSLRVSVSGDVRAMDALWEITDLRQGSAANAPLDLGRRRLVSHDDQPGFVLGLRHALGLRRVVVSVPGEAVVTLRLVDGTTVVCDPTMNVLGIYQSEGRLYLRYDGDRYSSPDDVRAAYGFA